MSLQFLKGVLNYSKKDLNLKACLKGGQSFRWTLLNETDSSHPEYIGVIRDKIFQLKQNENSVDYTVYYNTDLKQKIECINDELIDYFHLNENLDELYQIWSSRDQKFKERIEQYGDVLNGIRLLRLDPLENLFSFICSSNNNIKRITQMVNNMCLHFGKLIGEVNNIKYYDFPTIERLSEKDVEAKLRNLNFGYRAKFIHQAAVYIQTNFQDEKWLFTLREKDYAETVSELIKIPGIGKKVADCISLLSLDKLEAIPVDTHVLNLARNMYHFVPFEAKKSNSLSDKSYKQIGDNFRELWDKNNLLLQKSLSLKSEIKKEDNVAVPVVNIKRSNSDSLLTPKKNLKKRKSKN
ncbi:unnamed protein product [Brachionus calyciflorus]|uniref:N-glycosylase/DNA lyase n=1 Tax=Brachionus calyciflorus TaxID=104777 RepID=A0A814BIJ0_9BILA|nr:unnamed protein product [Brachionus calyciflorus]